MAETRGEAGWHAVHSVHFGEERWLDLHHALHREHEHLCFVNPFLPDEPGGLRSEAMREYQMRPTCIPGAFTFEMPDAPTRQYRIDKLEDAHAMFIEPVDPDTREPGYLSPFFLAEGASVIAALALQAEEGDDVLDACASLGGKALVLASSMFARACQQGRPMRGKLVCNEFSKERAAWLQRCVRGFLPDILFDPDTGRHPHVVFTSADVRTQSSSLERHGPYDRILLDAPSTDDRRLLRGDRTGQVGQPPTLDTWSHGKVKVSAERQVKWLYNMLWLLKEGGMVLYCSTALAQAECDGVIEAVMRKATGDFQLELLPLDEHILRAVPALASESTDWGTRLMPDKCGLGPLYFSRLRLVKRTHVAAELT